jgi:hypothetical protein
MRPPPCLSEYHTRNATMNKICSLVAMATLSMLGAAQTNLFTVADSIQMVHFNDPSEHAYGSPAWNISPDGSMALLVTTRGIVKSDVVESTLWTIDLRTIAKHLIESNEKQPPYPKSLFTIRGQIRVSFGSLITKCQWSPDSRTIYMLVERRGGRRELDKVNVITRREESLSSEAYSVDEFAIDGRGALYSGVRFQPNGRQFEPNGSGVVESVRGRAIWDLLWPLMSPDSVLFRADSNGTRSIAPASWWDPQENYFFLSPDGNTVVTLVPVNKTPATWKAYQPSELTGPLYWPASSRSPVLEYELVNLRTHSRRSLLGSPSGKSSGYDDALKVVWSQSRDHLLVTNTFLPLENQSPTEQKARLQPCAVAYVGVDDASAACIVFARSSWSNQSTNSWAVSDVRFGRTDHDVVVNYVWNERHNMECYASANGRWSEIPASACEANIETPNESRREPVRLQLLQSLDQPPTLWAEDLDKSRRIEIWNPNPQLAGKASGTTSIYRWFDQDKRQWAGGLIVPAGYQPGTRYPLVIQTHGFRPQEFMDEGASSTAMAARPLAAAGFVVLQVEDNHEQKMTSAEARINVDGFKAAIDRLAQKGIIDPKRVGIIGFSRTCWFVEESLIESPNLFTAAVMADGVDQSYLSYMLLAPENPSMESERENGGKPVGKDLQQWIEHAPDFRLSELRTPLRLQAINPASLLCEWEIYASLRVQNRPVDMVYLPLGQHVLQNPAERMASEQGDVDWFRFWLKGEEDHDPLKRGQYQRWEELRRDDTAELH